MNDLATPTLPPANPASANLPPSHLPPANLPPSNLIDRALRRVTGLWRDMAASVIPQEDDSLPAQMRACLDARGGEVSARNRAARLAETYLSRDAAGRLDFLRTLAGFDADQTAIDTAYATLHAAPDEAARLSAQSALRRALEPPRVRLLTQFTTIPDGMKFLVDLRASLLDTMKSDPHLRALESDLRGLLANWFDVGFLEMVPVSWTSPAILLERLVQYEAVHRIRNWQDLKNRLDSDRRCYAFFHPRMAMEPLIFVEVAMVQGLANSVQHLLDRDAPVLDPRTADTAIFYSISNCQRGLGGISFGNFLIKRAVETLSAEFRNLKTFATLSPLPGFRHWLDAKLAEAPANFITEEESLSLRSALATAGVATDSSSGAAALATLLAHRRWHRDPALSAVAEPLLLRLCATYLLNETRGRRALDPVAHFHMSNGARLERINPLADTSPKGLRESAGLMVNYLYDLAKIETYHEEYVGEGKRNAASSVKKLAKG